MALCMAMQHQAAAGPERLEAAFHVLRLSRASTEEPAGAVHEFRAVSRGKLYYAARHPDGWWFWPEAEGLRKWDGARGALETSKRRSAEATAALLRDKCTMLQIDPNSVAVVADMVMSELPAAPDKVNPLPSFFPPSLPRSAACLFCAVGTFACLRCRCGRVMTGGAGASMARCPPGGRRSAGRARGSDAGADGAGHLQEGPGGTDRDAEGAAEAHDDTVLPPERDRECILILCELRATMSTLLQLTTLTWCQSPEFGEPPPPLPPLPKKPRPVSSQVMHITSLHPCPTTRSSVRLSR